MLESRNYPPSEHLSRYIRRHYVFSAELPDGFELSDFLLSETPLVRLLIRGDWAAEMGPGFWTSAGPAVLFGSNSIPLKVRVKGAFTVAGFAIRPAAWQALFARRATEYTDAMVPLQAAWGDVADTLWEAVRPCPPDDRIVAAMETAVETQIARLGNKPVDAQMEQFELIARHDSTRRIEDAAAEIGLSVRQLERRCLATFGMTPKTVLRRSRFLDMAAAMRGFSSPSESQLAALRYFDDSHLNREFRRFAGMTPRKFKITPTPLLTPGLRLRAEGDQVSWEGSGPPPHESMMTFG